MTKNWYDILAFVLICGLLFSAVGRIKNEVCKTTHKTVFNQFTAFLFAVCISVGILLMTTLQVSVMLIGLLFISVGILIFRKSRKKYDQNPVLLMFDMLCSGFSAACSAVLMFMPFLFTVNVCTLLTFSKYIA